MKYVFIFFSTLFFINSITVAQPKPPPDFTTPPFGKIDKADLEMKFCDFEKDANAEVLFDCKKCYYSNTNPDNVITERHIRIKIFNDNAKDEANISIRYLTYNFEKVNHIEAETFNLTNGKIEVTRLDNNLIYTRKIDKDESEIVFSMPNVKAGSVIEYKYVHESGMEPNFPGWYIQNPLPMRYSEIISAIPYNAPVKLIAKYKTPGLAYIWQKRNSVYFQSSVAKCPSLPIEPYMRSKADVLADVTFSPSFNGGAGASIISNSLVHTLVNADYFGNQLDKEIKAADSITNKAFLLNTEKERLGYIFNAVKNKMKWNGRDNWFTNDGVTKAWKNNTGNSTEINLILYNMLVKSGFKACPLLVSTRENGKLNKAFTRLSQLNRTVILVPLNADSTKFYVLDATNKYNTFNVIPFELLNSVGVCLDVTNEKQRMVTIENKEPVKKVVLINAAVMPDGKLNGNAEIVDYGYNKIKNTERYKTDGEKKYIGYLKNNDNNIQVSSLKFENFDVDTLPLTQSFNFNINESSADQGYIFFNPCLFNPLGQNPFLSETRVTDIDFGYQNDFEIRGTYKVPDGYKADALPKSISLTMSDKSIVFKRLVGSQETTVSVQYSIVFKKSVFLTGQYPEIHDFFKKMYEMLDEQIILKKG